MLSNANMTYRVILAENYQNGNIHFKTIPPREKTTHGPKLKSHLFSALLPAKLETSRFSKSAMESQLGLRTGYIRIFTLLPVLSLKSTKCERPT
jgi:hypothetical protein